ncbi:glycosyltransferase [Prauserella muralis]|uniref:Uncharacterized protein n=1 Tax=Prauserella muralis TaxID=588067 RepID=A0A2V4AYY4_9PSEU|nr:glycosyltransferase [Prauserella muralis]PXY27114.1 hypothetical protein BAY60_11585 [Prauserella muralis]TWE23249.1 UDP:flavonoid glycosyltransferase YjiC (YdhE family) [Prauserella muralis]
MRVLFSSTAGAGHVGPLLPFARSWLRAGHDVLFCGPPALGEAGLPDGARFWPVDDPAEDVMAGALGRLRGMSHHEANEFMCRDIFGRLRPAAALPRLAEAVGTWRPDVVVRESAELAAPVAAELYDVPHARIGIGLGAMEEYLLRLVAAPVGALRRAHGLPEDPDAARLRGSAYLTLFPAGLEDPALPAPPHAQRFRDPPWATPPDGPGGELVYVTFGSVTGAMPELSSVYVEAMRAVADIGTDVLLTVGHGADLSALGTPPPNVRIERWVDQAEVLPRAAAVVCHGGGGTTLGALAAGVPLVVVPLFAEDQHLNAHRVAAAGAGVETTTAQAGAIRSALEEVLGSASHRKAARALAAELAGLPSTDDAPVGGLSPATR